MIIKKKCPHCSKQIELISEIDLGESILQNFVCGHSSVSPKLGRVALATISEYKSFDEHSPFPFQSTGVEFALNSECNCLIADEMGLGKTIQALVTLAMNRKELLPAIIICKTIAATNWLRETINWAKVIPQIVSTSKMTCHEQFKIHIVSFDLVARLINNPSWKKIAERCNTIIIDESHLIKNPTAKRSIAIKELVTGVPSRLSELRDMEDLYKLENKEMPQKKKVIALSGTPIKNNASEYFTILNILKPEKYYNYASFCQNNVEQYFDNRGNAWKLGGLKYPAEFKRETNNFILRRTMDEVLPDLPKVFRQFKYIELEDEVQKLYNEKLKEFCDFWESEEKKDMMEILAKMGILRHMTGLAKINYTIDLLMEFLGSTDRKITIFVHHKDVGEILFNKISSLCSELGLVEPLQLTADCDKQKVVDEFREGQSRILIASTLASGESINLQFCSDCIMHERQWNPGNEDQAGSGRFRRIGQSAERISLSFPVAVGTIDEYFAELVERKRQIFEEAMSGEKSEVAWNEKGIIMELGELLAQKGKEKWSIHS